MREYKQVKLYQIKSHKPREYYEPCLLFCKMNDTRIVSDRPLRQGDIVEYGKVKREIVKVAKSDIKWTGELK